MPTRIEWVRNPDGTPGETWNPVGRRRGAAGLRRGNLPTPLSWRKPRGVLLSSAGDLFHDDVPDEWIDLAMAVVALSPRHRFMLLTKRPRRMLDYLSTTLPAGRAARIADAAQELSANAGLSPDPKAFQVVDVGPDAEFGRRWFVKRWPLRNLRLGVSVNDQATADERIPILLRTPAAARFIAAEPMLGPIDLGLLDDYAGDPDVATLPCHSGRISWIVCGGDVGPGAKGMHPDWPRGVRDQCLRAGIPFFFNGWGEWAPTTKRPLDALRREKARLTYRPDAIRDWGDYVSLRVGRREAGHLLDGRAWRELPDAA